MFFPVKWITPRLKTFCIAFGTADMTLVSLSFLAWFFFFDMSFQAQTSNIILQKPCPDELTLPPGQLKTPKDERILEELRHLRLCRACGPAVGSHLHIPNFAGPTALIGASMGGYFILGGLLASLTLVHHPAARRTICIVTLLGESLSTLLLVVAVIIITANEKLCPTEYYFEHFQPLAFILVFTILFIATYKTYELAIVIFYYMEMSTLVVKEEEVIAKKRNTLTNPETISRIAASLRKMQSKKLANKQKSGRLQMEKSKSRNKKSPKP